MGFPGRRWSPHFIQDDFRYICIRDHMPKPDRKMTKRTRGAPQSRKGISLAPHSPRSDRRAAHISQPTEPALLGVVNRAAYQRRICDLELELSRLRKDLDDVRFKCSDLERCRRHYANAFEEAP